jgi:hypothetical protein
MASIAARRRTFDLRQQMYAVQRLGGLLGMFGDGPTPDSPRGYSSRFLLTIL